MNFTGTLIIYQKITVVHVTLQRNGLKSHEH